MAEVAFLALHFGVLAAFAAVYALLWLFLRTIEELTEYRPRG